MNLLVKITEHFPFSVISNDLAYPWQIGFQESASPGFSGIIELHDTIFFYLVVIAIGVFWLLGSVIYSYKSDNSKIVHKYLNHGTIKCLSNSVELKLNGNYEKYKENSRIYKLTTNNLSLYFMPVLKSKTNETLRLPIFPKFDIRRHYSNETLLSPITIKVDDKLSDNVNIFSEVEPSLDKLTPVKSYDNAYTYKKEIYKDNKGKAGIYRFYNKINGNFYFPLGVPLGVPLGEVVQ